MQAANKKRDAYTKDSLKLTLFQRKEDLEWDEKTFSGKFALMNLATMRMRDKLINHWISLRRMTLAITVNQRFAFSAAARVFPLVF
jgi:hypothetical protein